MRTDVIEIRQIQEKDIGGFYETFSTVVRERRYLVFLEPPPVDQTRAFVRRNIECAVPHLVAIDAGKLVGLIQVHAYIEP